MKIAFPSEEDRGLESSVSEHFGRCPYFIFLEIEKGEVKNVKGIANPYYGFHMQPGVLPQFLKDKGVEVVVAGGMGQRAIGFFDLWGIQTLTGVNGKIKDVLPPLLEGKLSHSSPCEEDEKGGDRK